MWNKGGLIMAKFIITTDSSCDLAIKELNELRRYLVEKLISLRENSKRPFIKKQVEFSPCFFIM